MYYLVNRSKNIYNETEPLSSKTLSIERIFLYQKKTVRLVCRYFVSIKNLKLIIKLKVFI